MALEFSQLFLAFQWFSLDEPFDKYLKVFAGDFDDNAGSCCAAPSTLQIGARPVVVG